MNAESVERRYPQKKPYPDVSAVRAACLFVVKALNKLVEEMNNQVYFDFDVNGLTLRAADKESLLRASNKLNHWKEQTSIGVLSDGISKEDYKKFIDSDLQGLLRQERAFINVISYDKFLAACELLEKKGYLEPKAKYEEIMAENKNFALLMCTKHRYKEIKERIEAMLEPLKKVKRKKKIVTSQQINLAYTWDDADEITTTLSTQKQSSGNQRLSLQEPSSIGDLSKDEKLDGFLGETYNESTKLTIKLQLCQWLHFFHKIVEFLMDSKITVNDIQISKDNGELEIRVHDEEQLGDLRRIIEKDGIIVEQVFQDKSHEFIEFILGEMEPEEREFFAFQNLKDLLHSAMVIGENIRQNNQSNQNEEDNNNSNLIIEKLLQYIKQREQTQKEFNEEHEDDYEAQQQQQQQEVIFLSGDSGVVKLFYETVERAEDQYSRRQKVSESGNENSNNFNNKNQDNCSNYNNMNSEQSSNTYYARKNEQKKIDTYEQESEKNNNISSQVTSTQVSSAISQFLGDDHGQNVSKDTTAVTVSLTTVDSSSVISNPSNSSVVFSGNTFQMRVFQVSEFQQLCQIFQKHKKLASTGLVQIDKILAIQPAQPVQNNTSNNSKNNNNKNNNNNINSPPQGAVIVNEVQYGVLRDFKQWSLREIIDQGLFFSVYQQINLTTKITAALDKIHRNPSDQLSWHGNIKPSNILVDSQFNVYFADCSVEYAQINKQSGEDIYLSSVKHLEQTLKEQFILGNPSLPIAECSRQLSQQFQQRKNDMIQQMIDLHNLGVCLYELFTNRGFKSEQYFQNVQLRGQVKRMAQESPTHVLHLIFTALHQLLEMQVTSAQELHRMFMEILGQL